MVAKAWQHQTGTLAKYTGQDFPPKTVYGPPCGEEEVVRGVHTLIAGVVQVYHRLHVVEEKEKGRKVEQEVEREDQGEETAHTWMTMETI